MSSLSLFVREPQRKRKIDMMEERERDRSGRERTRLK